MITSDATNAGSWAKAPDGRALRNAFSCFPSGVAAICALRDGRPVGMAASSFTSVSLDPPLASVCIARASKTWPTLREAPYIGLSVLAGHHEPVATSLSSQKNDRFEDVAWEATAGGAVLVHGSTLWLECRLEETLPAGDHEIVLLRILGFRGDPSVEPLVFHASSYRRLTAAP